jgi:8-oxo-dGTP pyrophosphatase MutT (NUDIX family)
MENRTNKQVEGIIFKIDPEGNILFLLMKRVLQKGGFWQPLTGGVRVGENLEQALRREVEEETSIATVDRIIDLEYGFNFTDHGQSYDEFIFGVQVPNDAQVSLSSEHEEYRWSTREEAISLLKWDGNIEGLKRLCQKINLA